MQDFINKIDITKKRKNKKNDFRRATKNFLLMIIKDYINIVKLIRFLIIKIILLKV